ncbi:MAG TPA: hypothetical protein ENH82_16495 [bacterium]|nr:hypothetical protein [bacterium]
MNRRNTFKIFPLAAASMFARTKQAVSKEKNSKPLCLQYLERVRETLKKIRSTESDNLLEASYNIARTYKKGGTCYNNWDMGHSTVFDTFPDRPGDPDICKNRTSVDEMKEGDLVLLSMVGASLKSDPREKGIFVIGAPAPWSAETPNAHLLNARNRTFKYRHVCELWINTYITTRGAIMRLPGESVPMGPVSGVLGMMTYWMMNADAVRILARDGVNVNVNGDEPELDEKAKNDYLDLSLYESLNRPLGSKYFAVAMRQLKAIEAELGEINTVAEMAVDTILSGGRICNYSRYRGSLCHEAEYRRGGLLLNKGIYAGENGPKGNENFPGIKMKSGDMVIMGITQPDDPVDMKMFRSFRKSGVKKIASIGAATRNLRKPSGDTVSGGTDIHLGNMCDTYGIFAIPGVKRKVCPTSGLLINQMFYAVQMQIAEKIIERTGNTPRIDANVAMEGFWNKRGLDFQIIKTRGY